MSAGQVGVCVSEAEATRAVLQQHGGVENNTFKLQTDAAVQFLYSQPGFNLDAYVRSNVTAQPSARETKVPSKLKT